MNLKRSTLWLCRLSIAGKEKMAYADAVLDGSIYLVDGSIFKWLYRC